MTCSKHPAIRDLKRIRRLNQFNDDQLSALGNNLTLEFADSNDCLIERGCCDQFSLYLLAGSLTATDQNEVETSFSYDSTEEIYPIAQIRPSMYRVVACEPVQFIKIHAAQLTEFAQGFDNNAATIDLVEIEQSAEENALTIRLFQDLISGNLKLPSLPHIAQRIQQAFAEDSVDADSLCTIIQSDPSITAKLIMIANSAFYRGLAPIESLSQAVVRLGLETTRKQVMTYAVKELFQSKTPQMASRMQQLWKHSQHVASLSRLIANHVSGFDLEQAQLAGLIHDLGEVAIVQYAQQSESMLHDAELLMRVVRTLRPQITGMLLNQWKFEAEFVTVGEECEDWFRNPSDQADLCDLVLIAQYHAFIGTAEMKNLPPVTTLPAFAKLGMKTLEIPQIVEFLQRSRTEIEAIESHLGSI